MGYSKQESIVIAYRESDRGIEEQIQGLFELPGIRLVPQGANEEGNTLPLLRYVQKKLYLEEDGEKLFFHPSMALLRMINIKRGIPDRFLEAVKLKKGDVFLDATMGLASDSLIAATAVGRQGKVVAVESSPLIYFLVNDGLDRLQEHCPGKLANPEKIQAWTELIEAASCIQSIFGRYEEVLAEFADKSVDVIYFDPMFRHTVKESSSMRPIKKWSNPDALESSVIKQACRVARRRVILKERSGSKEFERLGFTVVDRSKYSPVTYGVLDLSPIKEGALCSL
ncbi:class I SAM-dependent methyltransferase [Dehalobacter sp. DCM]|uniref:class I SAM-dependent methyltransferase n=1 Tax=Dehalobacter sp. DCM TaxID=2907827 RepID=UPI0030819F09|nr:class I SAM-dependent methyltransferase [Dehalobacter sp. DCM]